MQFSYLESGADPLDNLMGTLIQNIAHRMRGPATVDDVVPEVELPEDWKTFAETLSNYKLKYGVSLKELRDAEAELKRKKVELAALVEAEKLVESTGLKESLQIMIEEYKEDEKVTEYEESVKYLKGQCKAIKEVLENTNAEQMIKFQCFVCMERPVDTFMDPCGHLMCSTCWRRSSTTNPMCPGCRAQTRPKKMFFLS
jgi:hypothetical protein